MDSTIVKTIIFGERACLGSRAINVKNILNRKFYKHPSNINWEKYSVERIMCPIFGRILETTTVIETTIAIETTTVIETTIAIETTTVIETTRGIETYSE